MLKIGDFSRLANVTVKALRLYAEMGLLKPAFTDRFTGYRYYTLEQLPRLNRILALKDLGLSLEQIGHVLDEKLSADALRGMLALKQAELSQRVVEEQMRLARVEARLKQIEQEGRLRVDDVVVRGIEPVTVAFTLQTAHTQAEVGACLAAARGAIERWLSEAGAQSPTGAAAIGPWVVIYPSSEYVERSIPLEVGAVLDRLPARLPNFGRVLVRTLPALPAAAVYAHTGPIDLLPQAYAALYGWVESNGYRTSGPAREVYLHDGEDGSHVVEVQLPVEPILIPNRKETDMQPEIIEYRSFLVAGPAYVGDNANQEIADLWANDFAPRENEFKRVDPYVSYGVCEMDDTLTNGCFRYYAGVEIRDPKEAPEGMSVIKVPAGKYAVFKHTGSLDTLGKTHEYIYNRWLPTSGYQRDDRPDLEVYTTEFHDFQPDSILYLWVPIK